MASEAVLVVHPVRVGLWIAADKWTFLFPLLGGSRSVDAAAVERGF